MTRVRAPLSPPKKAPHMHMFCTVMLRCESRAGLGEPVEPVVKMTSAPSFSVTVEVIRPAQQSLQPSRGLRSSGYATPARQSTQTIACLESGRPSPPRCECSIHGQCVCTARHSSRKSNGAFTTQADKSARPEDFQRSNHLGGGQTQIQRGDDHADFETAIFQQNVIHGHAATR